MQLSALSLPDKTPETKGECMSDRGRPIGLHTYTTQARSGHGSQISLPVFRGRRRWALNGTMGGAQSRAPYMLTADRLLVDHLLRVDLEQAI